MSTLPCSLRRYTSCVRRGLLQTKAAAQPPRWRGLRPTAAFVTLSSRSVVSTSPFPVVDISPFIKRSSDTQARERAARELDEACCSAGFFYLIGHGVPEAKVSRMHDLAKEFFSLPAAIKDEIALSKCPEGGRGYQRLGENVTKGLRDMHEAIDFYAEPCLDDVDVSALTRAPAHMDQASRDRAEPFIYSPNQWPTAPNDLRPAAEEHFADMAVVGRALMDAMGFALGLPEDHFQHLTDRSFWCARIIGYPPLNTSVEGVENIGDSVGEHTDYGCWTILSQDDTPGALEARTASGMWAKVEPMRGAFVVNLGDMLSVWTRGRYAATPHRVRHTRQQFRTSVAFFFEPNFDAVIKPLDSHALSSRPVGREPGMQHVRASTAPLARALGGSSLVYGEHLYAKVSANFDFGDQSQSASL